MIDGILSTSLIVNKHTIYAKKLTDARDLSSQITLEIPGNVNMARVTVEDCLANLENRFQLVIAASKRARQLSQGYEPMVPWDNDKPTVVALREIAEEKVDVRQLLYTPVEQLNHQLDTIEVNQEVLGEVVNDFDISQMSMDAPV